jgi:sulfotransferase family protein
VDRKRDEIGGASLIRPFAPGHVFIVKIAQTIGLIKALRLATCEAGEFGIDIAPLVSRREFHSMDLVAIPYQFLTSLYHAVYRPELFQDVKTFVLFIGYPRSGHTLVGFLLDAHPDITVASQTSALRYLKHGFSRQQIFCVLAQNSRQVANTGREQRRYSYDVPNQWQGRFNKLRVIGESTGLTRLRRNPSLLKSLREKLQDVNLKLIHVIRNPYDNISTMKLRRAEPLPEAIKRYFSMCEITEQLKAYAGLGAVYDLKHETLISDPQSALKDLCGFVGLGAGESYCNDCASIIYKSPHKSRHEVEWTPELLDSVKRQMDRFPYLTGYSYED